MALGGSLFGWEENAQWQMFGGHRGVRTGSIIQDLYPLMLASACQHVHGEGANMSRLSRDHVPPDDTHKPVKLAFWALNVVLRHFIWAFFCVFVHERPTYAFNYHVSTLLTNKSNPVIVQDLKINDCFFPPSTSNHGWLMSDCWWTFSAVVLAVVQMLSSSPGHVQKSLLNSLM